MAHSCPDCGLTCHCGGDIDDLCFDDSACAFSCRHCELYDEREDDCDDFEEAPCEE